MTTFPPRGRQFETLEEKKEKELSGECAGKIVRRKCPALAGLLSASICGLGQVYNGQRRRGVTLFFLFGGLIGLAGAVWTFGVVDAYAGARRKRGN